MNPGQLQIPDFDGDRDRDGRDHPRARRKRPERWQARAQRRADSRRRAKRAKGFDARMRRRRNTFRRKGANDGET
jgi:hypothetical protein